MLWRQGYVRSMLVPPSWDQQSAKPSSWPWSIIWMNYRTRTGHGSDHLAKLENAMKMAWNKHAHMHASGRCVETNKQTNKQASKQASKQTNIDLEILLQRAFLHQSAFHPMSFLKPNLHLVTTVQCLDFANIGQPRHHQEHSSRCNFPAAFMLAIFQFTEKIEGLC